MYSLFFLSAVSAVPVSAPDFPKSLTMPKDLGQNLYLLEESLPSIRFFATICKDCQRSLKICTGKFTWVTKLWNLVRRHSLVFRQVFWSDFSSLGHTLLRFWEFCHACKSFFDSYSSLYSMFSLNLYFIELYIEKNFWFVQSLKIKLKKFELNWRYTFFEV